MLRYLCKQPVLEAKSLLQPQSLYKSRFSCSIRLLDSPSVHFPCKKYGDSWYSLQERNDYIELLEQTNAELEHAKQSEHVSVIFS